MSGRLTAEAGLSLAEVLRLFVPRGWFPPVTPGTKFVTLGDAWPADVHGKNHHRDGSFGNFVDRLTVLTAAGKEVACGPDLEREFFLATVGGMGLTGLVTEVTLRLRPVESGWIVAGERGRAGPRSHGQRPESSGRDWPYTVGWIDCLASGVGLGRGVLLRGRHAARAEVPGGDPRARRTLRVPLDAPEWLLSPPALRAFNGLYYWLKAGRGGGREGAGSGSSPTSPSSIRWTRSATGIASMAGAAFSSTSAWCPGRWGGRRRAICSSGSRGRARRRSWP